MKKSIIFMIFSLVMILSLNIISSAAYYGDINADGKITASDARSILRISAKLDKADNEKLAFADVNADGRVTASDARTVLRMSAKLEQLIEITTKAPETQPTTVPATIDSTTAEITTAETTSAENTTVEVTSAEITTEEPSVTEPATEVTTSEVTTAEPETEEPATETTTAEITTAEITTAEITTAEPTTVEITTVETTTVEVTTAETTTEISEETTTAEPETQEPEIPSEEITTAAPVTEAPEIHKHDYVGVVLKEASCTGNGIIVYTCECSDYYEETTSMTEHIAEWVVVTPADIGVEGLRQLRCEVCDTVLEEEIIPAEEEIAEEETDSSEEPDTEETTGEEPETEEDISYPEDIEAFLAGEYYISGKKGVAQKLKIAVSGSDTEIALLSGNAQLSVLEKSGKTYIKVISSDGEKYYVRHKDLTAELFGSAFTDMTVRFDFSPYSQKCEAVVSNKVEDDISYDVYTFEADGSELNFYVSDGNVVKIENITEEETFSFAVEEMSGEIPSDMLSTKGFTATGIENIPYIVPEFLSDHSVAQPSVKTYPAAIKVFLSGKYHISGTLYDGAEHTYSYTYDGTDKSIAIDSVAYFVRGRSRYIRDEIGKTYVQVNNDTAAEYGIDFDKVFADNTFALEGATECTAFEKSTYDGLPCDIYTLRDENGNMLKFTIVYERLARLALLDADGNEVKYIVSDDFDDDIPEGILTLVGYRRGDIEKILGIE